MAHILFGTCEARYAVDEVVAFAADVNHGRVGASVGGASDSPRGIGGAATPPEIVGSDGNVSPPG
jgi:hypothetical protein